MEHNIDLAPMVELAASVLFTLLSLAAAAGMRYLQKRTGIEVDEKHRKVLQDALVHSIDFALANTSGTYDQWAVENKMVAEAMKYMNKQVPDAIQHFKLGNEDLSRMVQSRLERRKNPPTGVVTHQEDGPSVG